MKKKNIFIVLLIALSFNTILASNGLCERLIVEDLSEEQAAKLKLDAAKMKKEVKSEAVVTPNKVNEWIDIGKNLGLALASVAKEVGVASDSFLESTTGKLTAIVILWKMMGKDLLGFISGTVFFICWFPLWIYLFRRMTIVRLVKVEYPKEGFRKIKHYEYYIDNRTINPDKEEIYGTRIVMAMVFIILVAITSVIF